MINFTRRLFTIKNAEITIITCKVALLKGINIDIAGIYE